MKYNKNVYICKVLDNFWRLVNSHIALVSIKAFSSLSSVFASLTKYRNGVALSRFMTFPEH